MTQARIVMPSEERMVSERPHLICWKSVFAGLLLSITAFVLLTSLGAGIAGFTAEGMINKEDGGSALATGAGLWLGISVVISLFCGSYFAVRVASFVTTRVGIANSIVIGSLFSLLLVFGLGKMIGGLGLAFGKLAQSAGEQTAHDIGDAGLVLFVVILAGMIGALFGGRTGAHTNAQRPFAKFSISTQPGFGIMRTEHGSVIPYIFGWLMGVPISILFLIAILRSVF